MKPTKAEVALQEQFDLLYPKGREGPDGEVRKAAFDRFIQAGLPNKRIEAWCYTNLRGAMREAKALLQEGEESVLLSQREGDVFGALPGARLLVVNGCLCKDASVSLNALPAGVEVAARRAVSPRESVRPSERPDVIGDLNEAFAAEEIHLRVAAGVELEEPIHLLVIAGGQKPGAAHSCVRVSVGPGARATILEMCEGVGDVQVTHVLECSLEEGATLEHVRFQGMPREAQFLSTVDVRLSESARLDSFILTSGASFSRCEVGVKFLGEGASAHLGGAFLLSGHQFGDATLFVDHRTPRCTSRQHYKFLLNEWSRGVFQGCVRVRPHAQGTDGKQEGHALLLSEGVEMNAKPELEIYADDVRCGHGFTSGRVDEQAFFYLRARGIPEQEAKAMLALAFVNGALEKVDHEGARSALLEYAGRWLMERG